MVSGAGSTHVFVRAATMLYRRASINIAIAIRQRNCSNKPQDATSVSKIGKIWWPGRAGKKRAFVLSFNGIGDCFTKSGFLWSMLCLPEPEKPEIYISFSRFVLILLIYKHYE